MSTTTEIKHPDGTTIVCTSSGGGSAPSAKPVIDFMYFPIAGRGELIRLICAVGDITCNETFPGPEWKSAAGFFGSLPRLEHGSLKMCQSLACQNYVASIAPTYKTLTPQQRAVDDMWMCTFEDMLAGVAKPIFGDKSTAPEVVKTTWEKFGTVLEGMTPTTGFINGQDFPTPADLVVLCIFKATMPFNKAIELCPDGYDVVGQFPKLAALAERTALYPAIKSYLASTSSMAGSL